MGIRSASLTPFLVLQSLSTTILSDSFTAYFEEMPTLVEANERLNEAERAIREIMKKRMRGR